MIFSTHKLQIIFVDFLYHLIFVHMLSSNLKRYFKPSPAISFWKIIERIHEKYKVDKEVIKKYMLGVIIFGNPGGGACTSLTEVEAAKIITPSIYFLITSFSILYVSCIVSIIFQQLIAGESLKYLFKFELSMSIRLLLVSGVLSHNNTPLLMRHHNRSKMN